MTNSEILFLKKHPDLVKFLEAHGLFVYNKAEDFFGRLRLICVALEKNSKFLHDLESKKSLEELLSLSKKYKDVVIKSQVESILKFNRDTQHYKNYEFIGYLLSKKLYELYRDKEKGTPVKIYNYCLVLIHILQLLDEHDIKIDSMEKLKGVKFKKFKNVNERYIRRFHTFLKENFKRSHSELNQCATTRRETENEKTKIEKLISSKKIEFKNRKKNLIANHVYIEDELTTYTIVQHDENVLCEREFVLDKNLNRRDQKIINWNQNLITKKIERDRIRFIGDHNTSDLNDVFYIRNTLLDSFQKSKNDIVPLTCIFLNAITGISSYIWEEVFYNKNQEITLKNENNKFYYLYHYGPNESNKKEVKIYFPKRINDFLLKIKNLILNESSNSILVKSVFERINNSLQINVNPTRLSNFFMNYFTTFFGLQPTYAGYISKKFTYYLESPYHYTKVNLDNLNEEYNKSYELFFRYTNPDREFKYSSNIITKSYDYVGSEKVPIDKDEVVNTFSNIKNRFENSSDRREKVNYRNLYVYFLLQLLCGHRPINSPQLNRDNFTTKLDINMLRINDKNIDSFFSYRFVPICEKLSSYLIEHMRFIDIYFRNIANYLFLLSDTGEMESFNSENLKELGLTKVSFSDRNYLRHIFRTTLFDNKLDENIINYYMGHINITNDYFSHYASSDFKKDCKKILDIQEHLISEYKIQL